MRSISVWLLEVSGGQTTTQSLPSPWFRAQNLSLGGLPRAEEENVPDLVVIRGRLGSDALLEGLRALARKGLSAVPVVVLDSEATTRNHPVGDFRTGVVSVFTGAGTESLATHLLMLEHQLPARPDCWSGAGPGATLSEFLEHARATCRSGVVYGTSAEGAPLEAEVTLGLPVGESAAADLRSACQWRLGTYTFVPESGASEVQTPADRAIEREARADPAGPRLLFVDDDDSVRTLVARYFARRGYSVTTAGSGAEALLRVDEQVPDLIVADLNMPGMDGWSLLRFLRQDVRVRETPVAIFSAQDNFRDTLRSHHAGALAYFSKTMRLEVLERELRGLLEPRERFRRLVKEELSSVFDVAALGPAWVLRTLGHLEFTGALDMTAEEARIRLTFQRGLLTSAAVQQGDVVRKGDDALAAYFEAERAQCTLAGSADPPASATGEFVESAVRRLQAMLASKLGDERRRVVVDTRRGGRFRAQPGLLTLYLDVAPPRLQRAARALCQKSPATSDQEELLAMAEDEVNALVEDLVGRGVLLPEHL